MAALHNALDDKPMRARLQAAVGDVLAEEALAATRLKAADVLGDLHDEKVWTPAEARVAGADLEAALPLHLRVVAAAGKVAACASVTPLLDLAKKAKDPNLVRASVEALGGFGWAKNRVTILLDLGGLIPLTEGGTPGGVRGAKVSPESAAAWRELEAHALEGPERAHRPRRNRARVLDRAAEGEQEGARGAVRPRAVSRPAHAHAIRARMPLRGERAPFRPQPPRRR